MKRLLNILAVLMVATFVLSACGTAATPAATSAPAATTAPAATAAQAATSAPAATSGQLLPNHLRASSLSSISRWVAQQGTPQPWPVPMAPGLPRLN